MAVQQADEELELKTKIMHTNSSHFFFRKLRSRLNFPYP